MSHRNTVVSDASTAVGPAQWVPPVRVVTPSGDGPEQYVETL